MWWQESSSAVALSQGVPWLPPDLETSSIEDVTVTGRPHPSQLLSLDSSCYPGPGRGVTVPFLSTSAPRSSGLLKCPQPSALVCAGVHVTPGGESHFTPHRPQVCLRGAHEAAPLGRWPVRRSGSSVHMWGKRHVRGTPRRPGVAASLEVQTQTGASGWLCVLGGRCPLV